MAEEQEQLLKCPNCRHTTFEGSLAGGKALLTCSRCRAEYTLAEIVRAAQRESSEPEEPEPE